MTNSKIWLSQIIQRWENLLDEVEYKDIPLEYVQRLTIHLKDGSRIDLHLSDMVQEHDLNYARLERSLDRRLDHIQKDIKFVDWHIDAEKTGTIVSRETNRLLGKIK